jgi:hypothetical protein
MAAKSTASGSSKPKSTERGRKATVYLSAAQARHLDESGLKIADIVDRGLSVTPVSADGTIPEPYRTGLEYMSRVLAALAAGGSVWTAMAEPALLDALASQGASEVTPAPA